MPEPVDLRHVFGLPPRLAIAYFEAKGYTFSWNWWETWQDAQATAFTVAKVARADVLEAIREETAKIFTDGITGAEFRRRLEPRLKALGWWGRKIVTDSNGGAEVVQEGSPWRLDTIFRTNAQSGYMAGRYAAQLSNAGDRPFWQYVAVMDDRTRPSHAALNGRVYRYDDPFWESFYPPIAYNCRCRVRALSQRQVDALGIDVESSAGRLGRRWVDAGTDKRTGEVIQRPVTTLRTVGPDGKPFEAATAPGWSYNPGASAFGTDSALASQLAGVRDQSLLTQAVQALNNSSERQAAWANWVDNVLPGHGNGHSAQVLHWLTPRVGDFVQQHGRNPAMIVAMNEKSLAHAASAKRVEDGLALTAKELADLPKLLSGPDVRVYWDYTHDNLLYAIPAGAETILVPVTPRRGMKKVRAELDALVNAFKIRDSRLDNRARFEPMGETP